MSLASPKLDWQLQMQDDERLLWTGQPEPDSLLIFVGATVLASLVLGPMALLGLLIPAGVLLVHARDRYALTDKRVLAYRQPFAMPPRLDSLPRNGTYAGPRMGKGPRAVVFTAPDRRKIVFGPLGRDSQRMLINSYPKGGPETLERPAT